MRHALALDLTVNRSLAILGAESDGMIVTIPQESRQRRLLRVAACPKVRLDAPLKFRYPSFPNSGAERMAAKRRSETSVGPRGPRGRRGKTGETGKAGPPGPPANGDLKKLAAQVDQVVKELQVQLTRIAQIQAQLDRLAAGQAPEARNRRSSDRISH